MRAAELSLEEALHPLGVIKSVVDEVVVVQSHQAAPIMNDDSGNPSTNISCCHYPEHYQLTFLSLSRVPDRCCAYFSQRLGWLWLLLLCLQCLRSRAVVS